MAFTGSAAFTAKPAVETATTTTSQMAVVARSFHLTVAGRVSPGPTSVRLVNVSRVDDHAFVALNLGPLCLGFTEANAIAELDRVNSVGGDPIPVFLADCPGGAVEGVALAAAAPPVHQVVKTFNMVAGRTLYFCGVREQGGTPHYKLGMIGFFDVPGPVANP